MRQLAILAALAAALQATMNCAGERSPYVPGGGAPDIGPAPSGGDLTEPGDSALGDASRPDAGAPADVAARPDLGAGTDAPTDVPAAADGPARPDAARPATVTVVTLNLRCLLDDWAARLPILVDALAALDPDVVGFQEVCHDTQTTADNLAELMAALEVRTGDTWTARFAGTHRGWNRYDEGIAVASRHGLATTEVVALPTGVFPRKVVMARIDAPAGALVFATTHLDHQDADVRGEQAAAVVEALSAFSAPDDAVILTGDMNEGPEGGAAAAFEAAGFADTWAALHPGDPGPTIPSSAPNERIDYVRLRPGASGWAPLSVERILTAPVGGVYGSDHLGVAAVVGR